MIRFFCCILWIIVYITIVNVVPAQAGLPTPLGFILVEQAPGIELFRKDYPNGVPDFVQVIDLTTGAKVIILHGNIVSPGRGQGAYGGDNPSLQKKTIQEFWWEFTQVANTPFCVTNGQFFRMGDGPSVLPFPLKRGGQIITDGYAKREFPEKKLMLELWADHADIRELSMDNFYNSNAPDIVAGLREDAEKARNKAVGRTFIGVADADLDDQFELLLIFNTRSAKPSEAADVLRSFGAARVMMLDGGGSTNLVCQGAALINSDRPIPQALGIMAAREGTIATSDRHALVSDIAEMVRNKELPEEKFINVAEDVVRQPDQAISDRWGENDAKEVGTPFHLKHALLVPLIMLPLGFVIFILVRRRQNPNLAGRNEFDVDL